MKCVFLSFAAEDREVAAILAAQLEAAGIEVARNEVGDIELDPDRWGDAASNSDATVVVIGKSGLRQSQMLHVALAAEVSHQVIPVLLDGVARPSRAEMPYELADVPWIEAGANANSLCDRVVGTLSQNQVETIGQSTPVHDNPYRGLAPFEESDVEDFFGREGLVASVAEDIVGALQRRRAPVRFLAVVGPSGSGKSSLVRAGIVPRLREVLVGDGGVASALVTRPGSRPLDALAIDIVARCGKRTVPAVRELESELRRNDRALHHRLGHDQAAGYTVLVVDQFEELFTLGADTHDRAAYIANLLNAATAPGGRTVVLVTLRADFYGHCATDPRLAFYVQSRQALVGRMTDAEMRRAIQRPAERRACRFAPGLVERLLQDAGQDAGSLPLLQFALTQLWRRRDGDELSHDTYEAIGGVGGALAERADALYASLSDASRELCRRLLLRLIQPGEGTDDTRRRVPRKDLRFRDQSDAAVDAMLDALAAPDVRLVMTDGSQDGPTVEITHEALLSRWPMLARWRDEERESLLFHRRIISGSADWRTTGDDSSLLQGTMLLRAVEWVGAHSEMVNIDEERYIAASVQTALTTSLECAVEALPAALERAGAFGDVLDPAIRACLAVETNVELRRRLLVLASHRSAEETDELISALRTVTPSEFTIVAAALRKDVSAEWVESLFSEQKHNGGLRRLLTAVAVAPMHERWPQAGAHFAALLADEDAVAVGAWIPTVRLVGAHIAPPLLAIACNPKEEQRRRLTAGRLLVLVAGEDPTVVAALLATDELELYAAARDCAGSVFEGSIAGTVEVALDKIARGATVPSQPAVNRGGAIAALGDLGAWDLARERLERSRVGAASYEFARYLALRGVAVSELGAQLDCDAPATWIVPVALALSQYRPDAVPFDVLERAKALFVEHPSAAVHAASGLLVSRIEGEDVRSQLDRSLASSVLDCRVGREWCVWDGTGAPLTFVLIRAGRFQMGSHESEFGRGVSEIRHEVVLSGEFLLADRVLTRSEYEPLAQAAGFVPHTEGIEETCPTEKHPAIMMTWEEAGSVCRYLSSRVGDGATELGPPSEAEWEYACRAETETAYHFGNEASKLDLYGWYLGNARGRHAREARALWPNQWGLFDMHGLLYEWCLDYYGVYDQGTALNPRGPREGASRVLRGGGYNYSAQDCRSAYRYFTHETNRHPRIGLRLAARR